MVEQEKINWTAIYKNGTRIRHIKGIKYDTLDRSNLEAFEVSWMNVPVVTVHLQENQQLIWRKRTEQAPGGVKKIVYLCGWREMINGKDVQTITYIFDRNTFPPEVHVSGKFDRERNSFFYPPEWREFELPTKDVNR